MSKLTVALVAHDHKKPELLVWVKQHIKILEQCNLVATGTTGGLINKETGLEVTRYKSGPLGGDQQIGALIAENKLDALFFFWDPLNAAPHDPDVKALLRLCSVWNVPVACTPATADLVVTSPWFLSSEYKPIKPTF
ncbi:methylglyoxal synthase [Alteromonas australica]|jgi:methylglyoxal synthase|uniref:Methylglyoxal synthase n=1 Tax=Alteromonas australica TaxID=589873 RepID=A0A075P2Q6_9ALTE|nr:MULTISPECIES: methylglyoxal synthase [Alteromonas]MAO28712.1 methylglyoxal synthase [Alteromonas sp.]AIF97627.1 methylglyoxal synthase [Alteromonas australica]AJP42730.1 methylglyoxal synthase [Alteromonas australica]QPL49659.1 methylglyoxal synthase [Alteromonas sp. B31-7]HAI70708.1 methylglyoxal synthase [Alteromonas australica]|tara:strand:- start:646 stop:1056 length:411 start_codon:yes stop_codon:yes gene_type:complete